ncbi:MAG TPA: response regulator [Mucilaginibacter sp.]|nr:response regulator [Mucilaginibacter sp.]
MKKLIFIDDSQLDHFILKRVLRKYDLAFDVNCTADVREVISFLEQNRGDEETLPDIILVDIYMPGLDGWAFLDKLQSIYPSLSKEPRVYILSSSISPRDIRRAKNYPFVRSFIFKPITKESLEKYMNEEVSNLR